MSRKEAESLPIPEEFLEQFDNLPEVVRAKYVGSAEDCDGIIAKWNNEWLLFARRTGAERMGHGNMAVDTKSFFRQRYYLKDLKPVNDADGLRIPNQDEWRNKEVMWFGNSRLGDLQGKLK